MASASQSTSFPSQPSATTQVASNTQKIPIQVNEEGLVVGPYYAKWGTRVGRLIRSIIPPYFSDWRQVPQVFKDKLWKSLMEEFTLNVSEKVARPFLEKGFPPKWRVIKSRYRSQIIRKSESMEAAIAACPEGIDPNHWADFVIGNEDPKVKEKCTANAEIRKKRQDYNNLGRQSFAQRVHLLNERSPQKKHGRTYAWKNVHERPDGTILECSREQYELVKAACEMDMNASSGDNNDDHLLIESDALSKVFGKDKGSRTRGVSSHISNKQVQRTTLVKALLEQAKEENRELKKQKIDTASRLDKLEGLMMDMVQMNRSENSQQTNNSNPSARIEVRSTSIPFSSQSNRSGQNNISTRPDKNPIVNLLARDGTVVAKGFVETNATKGFCHGKKVLPFEKKVFVEEVFDGNAPIYDRPQDGNTILQDVIDGGYLIWLNDMLQYV